MKARSLTQPWASLVAIGAKRFETRSWSTRHRGLLAIQAAKKFPEDCMLLCRETPFVDVLYAAGFTKLRPLVDLCGHVVAVVDLVDVVRVQGYPPRLPGLPWPGEHEEQFGNYAPGRYAWITRDAFRLRRPIQAKGAQGVWETLAADEHAVLEQMAEAAA